MSRKSLWELLFSFCAGLVLVLVGGCSPGQYKAEADKEVYEIIDSKWDDSFGERVNYTVSDVNGEANDVKIGEVAGPNVGVISLAEAVLIATSQNRNYQAQKESLYLVALDLTLERHAFARQWFGTVDASYARNVAGTSRNDDEQVGTDSEVGFSQLLADGAIVSTSIALDWTRFLTGDSRKSLGSVLAASFSQPLLRGAGRKIVQEQLTQAEREALYQIRSFNRFRKEFVVSIVSDYYQVLRQRDRVTNAENNYNRRVESKQRLEMLGDAGRRNRFEVDQAQQDVLKAKDSLVSEQQRYAQQLDEFKIRLALATDEEVELEQGELRALERIGVSEVDYTVGAAIETALLGRLDLANSTDRVDDSVRKVMVAADGLGAELNLVGSARAGSTPETDYKRLQFHEGRYDLGIEADLPFDRKLERNAYREALIALEQSQRGYQNDEDEVKLDVRQAYRDLLEAAERYQIQSNSLALAEKRVESTNMLIEAGRATTRDLLESQDALIEAQNAVTSALVGHAIAKLNFFRDIGVLQVNPDGMWVQREVGSGEDKL